VLPLETRSGGAADRIDVLFTSMNAFVLSQASAGTRGRASLSLH
jgi:hypothetical protein